MVVSASHAVVHDHESHDGHSEHEDHRDHGGDFEGECVVCSVAALSSGKISASGSTTLGPKIAWLGFRLVERVLIVDAFGANANTARGPPLSFFLQQ